MTRTAILDEIKRLESVKADNPTIALGINAQITKLCDRLKGQSAFKPRKVV